MRTHRNTSTELVVNAEPLTPFTARLAVSVVWAALEHARRGDASDTQLKLAQQLSERLSDWLERAEFDGSES